MTAITPVRVGTLGLERFASILSADRYELVRAAMVRSHRVLDGRVVWNVNSTARGGGVAEMLVSLLAYAHGAGVDTRWAVITGTEPFFAVTKRIHNNLHSAPGDGGTLGHHERTVYEEALAPNVDALLGLVRPEDVVIVHDPQPAGVIPALKRVIGVPVIWRCHVGIDTPSDLARGAWDFLTPYVQHADAYVFSRRAFVWEGLDDRKLEVIPPTIDPFSPKNQPLDSATVRAILAVAGLDDSVDPAPPVFTREDGAIALVQRRATITEGRPLRRQDRVVLQVSRWDRLKDPVGVIVGFVEQVAPSTDAHLVYAGPAVEAIVDDPEGVAVLEEVHRLHRGLSPALRDRVHLACLPMDDAAENAAMVNALQRRADVVVQKSFAEGFGLTVAEAMWKGRPVVASRIGGIQDQIVDGVSGVLLDDPLDLGAYGAAVGELLRDPERAALLGTGARERACDEYLAVRSLLRYLDLIERLVS